MAPLSSAFSKRLEQHPSIVWRLQPHGLMLAVNGQLLVGERALAVPAVHAWLKKNGWSPLTTLLTGLKTSPAPDVTVYEHAPFPQGKKGAQDVVGAARKLRKLVPGDERQVSPNHVLVPASLGHSCPFGAPSPVNGTPSLQAPLKPELDVTVIDSGYQWDYERWGANPLGSRVNHTEADWLSPLSGWQPGDPDTPGESVPSPAGPRLAALAGHANFIAGVIAQGCPHAQITIRNHNGLFEPTAQDFPTEASVARALIQSAGAPVIDVGFAFWVLDGIISCAWDTAFTVLGGESIVVAPAGNQSSPYPRYPAALATIDPKLFRNAVGVASRLPAIPPGSLAPNGLLPPPLFTNYGRWVTCSADGHEVESTFLRVDMRLEDQEPVGAGPENFANAWATWNGTSFAAPKVVAAIATHLAAGAPSPQAARDAVLAGGVRDPRHRLGIVLNL
jgi:hypothetical protein